MTILRTEGLTKRFGGLTAVDHLDLEVEKGEITALIGPNGSGKTTVLNLITGVYKPDAGKVFLEDRPISGEAPHEIAEGGIARTFQTIRLFERLTVLQNVLVGRHLRFRSNLLDALISSGRLSAEEKKERERAEELLELVGLKDKANELPSSLPYGYRRSLEIARAVATEPSLLLLDEPAAGMNREEIMVVQELIKKLCSQGLSILLVEHTMELVEAVAKKVVVLNYGKKIAEGSFESIEKNREVIEAYLGKGEI